MLEIGQVIVHPTHGKGALKEIKKMLVLGQPTWYYVFEFSQNELDRVMIPTDKIEESGIREPVKADVIDKALDYLRSEETDVPDPRSNFHRIHKEYTERISKGCILEVAKVYKALWFKGDSRELGLKDKLLFEKTESLLVGEIEAACHLSEEESKKVLMDSISVQ